MAFHKVRLPTAVRRRTYEMTKTSTKEDYQEAFTPNMKFRPAAVSPEL